MSKRLTQAILAKCNDKLQLELTTISAKDKVRILATLKVRGPEPIMPDPRDFPSRVEFRKACIALQTEYIERETKETMAELKKLPLDVSEPKATRVVVIIGAKEDIIEALALNGVIHASLDQPIEINRPKQ